MPQILEDNEYNLAPAKINRQITVPKFEKFSSNIKLSPHKLDENYLKLPVHRDL